MFEIVVVTLLGLIVALQIIIARRSGRPQLSTAEELEGVLLLHTLDYEPVDTEQFLDTKKTKTARSAHKISYVTAVSRIAKARFGMLKDNSANRRVVRSFVLDEMEKHGMRPSDAQAVIDQIIILVFVPDIHQLKARKIEQSAIFVQREREYRQQWEGLIGRRGPSIAED